MIELLVSIVYVSIFLTPTTIMYGSYKTSEILQIMFYLTLVIQVFGLSCIQYILLKLFKVKDYIKSIKKINTYLFIYASILFVFVFYIYPRFDYGEREIRLVIRFTSLICLLFINKYLVTKIIKSDEKKPKDKIIIIILQLISLSALLFGRILFG